MLVLFDAIIGDTIDAIVGDIIESFRLSNRYNDLVDVNFCQQPELRYKSWDLEPAWRINALKILTWELQRVYQKSVVVLIDDYDLYTRSAIEHGYAALVCPVILLYCSCISR
jgi:hypothetical protein